MLYWFCVKFQDFLDNYVCNLISEGMYVNLVAFRPVLWKMKGDFIDVGIGEDFGREWKIAFKTTTCGKVDIQSPYGTKGVSHGEACAWFEGTWNFVARLAYNEKQPTPLDNDRVLLQCQETMGD